MGVVSLVCGKAQDWIPLYLLSEISTHSVLHKHRATRRQPTLWASGRNKQWDLPNRKVKDPCLLPTASPCHWQGGSQLCASPAWLCGQLRPQARPGPAVWSAAASGPAWPGGVVSCGLRPGLAWQRLQSLHVAGRRDSQMAVGIHPHSSHPLPQPLPQCDRNGAFLMWGAQKQVTERACGRTVASRLATLLYLSAYHCPPISQAVGKAPGPLMAAIPVSSIAVLDLCKHVHPGP